MADLYPKAKIIYIFFFMFDTLLGLIANVLRWSSSSSIDSTCWLFPEVEPQLHRPTYHVLLSWSIMGAAGSIKPFLRWSHIVCRLLTKTSTKRAIWVDHIQSSHHTSPWSIPSECSRNIRRLAYAAGRLIFLGRSWPPFSDLLWNPVNELRMALSSVIDKRVSLLRSFPSTDIFRRLLHDLRLIWVTWTILTGHSSTMTRKIRVDRMTK